MEAVPGSDRCHFRVCHFLERPVSRWHTHGTIVRPHATAAHATRDGYPFLNPAT